MKNKYENKLWFKIFRRFSVLLALKSTLVILICYYLGSYLSAKMGFISDQIGGLWCAISGIIVLQVLIHESFSAASLRITGSFIGAVISFIMIQLTGYTILTLTLCTLFTVMITSFLKLKPTFRLATLTGAIIIIIGFANPSLSPLLNASSRFLESAIGSLIAIGITAIFYPLRKKLHLLQH